MTERPIDRRLMLFSGSPIKCLLSGSRELFIWSYETRRRLSGRRGFGLWSIHVRIVGGGHDSPRQTLTEASATSRPLVPTRQLLSNSSSAPRQSGSGPVHLLSISAVPSGSFGTGSPSRVVSTPWWTSGLLKPISQRGRTAAFRMGRREREFGGTIGHSHLPVHRYRGLDPSCGSSIPTPWG